MRDRLITSNSLQNYLSAAIPAYIRENRDEYSRQNPFARIVSENEFVIREIIVPEKVINTSQPNLELEYEKAYLRKVSNMNLKKASGFKKGYTIPKYHNHTSESFVQRIFSEETKDEIQHVYEQTKQVFNLRRVDVKSDYSDAGGSVSCKFFSYSLSVSHNETDLDTAVLLRTIHLYVSIKDLTKKFDQIFQVDIDELIIPILGISDFDDLVVKFENLKELDGGDLREDDQQGVIEYVTQSHTSLTIDTVKEELIITHYYSMPPMDLISHSIENIRKLSQHDIRLLTDE